jgi:heparanase 1
VCVLFVQPGITLLLINLSGNTTAQVSVTVTTQGAVAAHKHGARKHVGGRKFRHVHDPSFTGVDEAAGAVRDEYHLTPKDGNLRSQVMLLNGRALATDAAGNIPTLEAVKVDAAQPIAVAPYSIMFARISHFNAPACS